LPESEGRDEEKGCGEGAGHCPEGVEGVEPADPGTNLVRFLNEAFGEDGKGRSHARGRDEKDKTAQAQMRDRFEEAPVGREGFLSSEDGGAKMAGQF